MAAELDHDRAQYEMGMIHRESDPVQAYEWFLEVSLLKNTDATGRSVFRLSFPGVAKKSQKSFFDNSRVTKNQIGDTAIFVVSIDIERWTSCSF